MDHVRMDPGHNAAPGEAGSHDAAAGGHSDPAGARGGGAVFDAFSRAQKVAEAAQTAQAQHETALIFKIAAARTIAEWKAVLWAITVS